MTLEEAIRHAEEVEESCQLKAYNIERNDYKDLEECANEHRQLAEWLKELKERREKDVLDTNAGDTISRQAAIDILSLGKEILSRVLDNIDIVGREKREKYLWGLRLIESSINDIEELSSAQPENIRCYECKHGTHSGCGNVYICNVSPELVMEHTGDFYCGYAERKDDD